MMPPEEAMKLAGKYGINLPEYGIAGTRREASELAGKIGYPVVMKVCSPKISHKTDVGGVVTGVRKGDAGKVFDRLKSIRGCRTVLVQRQVSGIETIAGGLRDSQFGPCVSFGAGGIFVEILRDVNFRVCPISGSDAREMVKEAKVYKILRGYRGVKYDVEGVVKTLINVSRMMIGEKIRELDINPLICSRRGAWAADVRVE